MIKHYYLCHFYPSSQLFVPAGAAVRVHVDGDALLRVRHHRDAAVREPGDRLAHRRAEAQQLQTHFPEPPRPLQVSIDID